MDPAQFDRMVFHSPGKVEAAILRKRHELADPPDDLARYLVGGPGHIDGDRELHSRSFL